MIDSHTRYLAAMHPPPPQRTPRHPFFLRCRASWLESSLGSDAGTRAGACLGARVPPQTASTTIRQPHLAASLLPLAAPNPGQSGICSLHGPRRPHARPSAPPLLLPPPHFQGFRPHAAAGWMSICFVVHFLLSRIGSGLPVFVARLASGSTRLQDAYPCIALHGPTAKLAYLPRMFLVQPHADRACVIATGLN
jgi:hypothetical protein